MTQMSLKTFIGSIADISNNNCFWEHGKGRNEPPLKTNVWDNSSTKLGENLETDAPYASSRRGLYEIKVEVDGVQEEHLLKYNAHHLIPADASWPKAKILLKWMNKGDRIRSDVGYDVNCSENGISLPSSDAKHGPWSSFAERFQTSYAFAAIEYQANAGVRQFHDGHKAYSEFVVKCLKKIGAKLEQRYRKSRQRKMPVGCDKNDCPTRNCKNVPLPPPVGVIARVNEVSRRLSSGLIGDPSKWKKPVMTSRFSLIYRDHVVKKIRLSQKQARQQLAISQFKNLSVIVS